jgi:hypothetical protein
MTATISSQNQPEIVYLENDGQLVSENTKKFQLIAKIQGGIDALFKDNENVFVAGNLLWYPVEGNNKICQTPNVMVAFGRPKGDRSFYQQWLEDNIAPQVVFQILPLRKYLKIMFEFFDCCQRYGVEEYYVYDIVNNELTGLLRKEGKLDRLESTEGWVSPRLQVRFETASGDLEIYRPDGQKFLSYMELSEEKELARQQMEREREEKELALQKVDRLAEKLRELNINPNEL